VAKHPASAMEDIMTTEQKIIRAKVGPWQPSVPLAQDSAIYFLPEVRTS
jgi:hypothetical protein